MAMMGLFLYGEDELDDVRQIRADALASLASGRVVEWTNENTSVKKANGLDLRFLVKECDYFLRMYDPQVRKQNPIITVAKPNLLYP